METGALAVLREALPGIVLGQTFVLLGLAALLGSLFTWRRREFSLLYFGLFAVLYGIRILLVVLPVDRILGLQGPGPRWLEVTLGYVSQPLIGLFLVQIFGPGRSRSLRWYWRGAAVCAAAALAIDLATGRAGAARIVMALLSAAGIVILGVHALDPAFRRTREQKGVMAAFLLAALVSLNNTLVDHGWVPWEVRTERPGLLIALVLICYLLISRVLDNRAHMLALRDELDLARSIQESILPDAPPRVPGLDVAVHYRPMMAVAGDYYDFRRLDDDRLGVLVADVSGHGIPAALIASMLRVAFAAQVRHLGDPAALLEGINTSLYGTFDRQFVTAVYCVADRRAGTLTCAGAAHPPLLVRRAAGGPVEALPSSGLMLGMFPEVNAGNLTVPLAPGDRVVACTDGFAECADTRGELYGEERLEAFLAADPSPDAAGFAAGLVADLERWRGIGTTRETFDDDLTMVVVDVSSPPIP